MAKEQFLAVVDDSGDNHYFVGVFGDEDEAQMFLDELALGAGVNASGRVVPLSSEDDVLKLFPVPEPLVITEG